MSASLVGSEMCIRDRSMPMSSSDEASEPEAVLEEFLEAPRAGAGAPRSTVSYTHLTLPTICSV
eukprot:4531680-Alexandrium_andersonii.AAC.1